jgi:hypothetical protein
MNNRIIATLSILCFVTKIANCLSFDDFSLPDFGNSPVISEVRRPLPEGRPIKVAVACIIPGSACKNQADLAKGLSQAKDKDGQPMYNVTLITPIDKEVKTTETLHKFALPYTMEETDVTKAGEESSPGKQFEIVTNYQKLLL